MKIARKKTTHLITANTDIKILSERVSTMAGIKHLDGNVGHSAVRIWDHLSRRDRTRLLKKKLHAYHLSKRHRRWTARKVGSIQSFRQYAAFQVKAQVLDEIQEKRLKSLQKRERFPNCKPNKIRTRKSSDNKKRYQIYKPLQRSSNIMQTQIPSKTVATQVVKEAKKQTDRFVDVLDKQRTEKKNQEYNAYNQQEQEKNVGGTIRRALSQVVISENSQGTIANMIRTISLLFWGVIQFFLPVLLLVVLLAVLFGVVASDNNWIVSTTAQWDPVMYLTCKYESGGDPGAIGSGGFGGYGFDEKTWGTVSKFIVWAYEKDPDLYADFEPYMTGENLWYNEDFKTLWKNFAATYKRQFDADQECYAYNQYFVPAANYYTSKTGYDFYAAPNAVKAALASISIRNGAYSLNQNLAGVTAKSSPKDIIDQIYAVEQKRHTDDPQRWVSEYQDALAMLNDEIDIYEPSTGANGRGYIDWSWKRPTSTSAGSDIVAYADQFVGNPYVWGGDSLTNGIDCSHFVWRVLLNTGHYSGSYLTSAGWRTAGTPVASLDQAIAGDIICYDGHVAIYDGNGMIVEAKGSKWGITHDRRADHATILAIRRFT